MRLRESVWIGRPPKQVFALVSDLARGPEWFVGITRWEPRSRKRRGVGARYRVLVKVGSIEAGGTLAVTEWKPGKSISWESVDGIEQRGRWTIRPRGSGAELGLEVEFGLPGGPVGRLAELLAGRVIARDMSATLLAARRILEFDDGVPGSRSSGTATRAKSASSRSTSSRSAAKAGAARAS